ALPQGTLSPYHIERYIKDNKTANLKELFQLLGPTDTSEMPNTYEGFSARHWDIPTGDGKNVVLRISYGDGYDNSRYLVFREDAVGGADSLWTFVGYFDCAGQHYYPPDERVEAGFGRVWFVVQEVWERGSGISLFGENWYEISDKPPREVLSYPKSGHNFNFPILDRKFWTDVKSHGLADGVHRVDVWFGANYTFNGERDLFSKMQIAHYSWNEERHRFTLEKAGSDNDVSEEQLNSIYTIDSFNDDKFVMYALPNLLRLATNGSTEQKDWLTEFLDNLKNSPEKRKLLDAMK